MKIPDWCVECVSKYICKVEVKRGGKRCVNFHDALESKLQSAEQQTKFAICCPKCKGDSLYYDQDNIYKCDFDECGWSGKL